MKKQAERKYKNKEHISFQKSISIMAAVGFLVNSITASGSEITATQNFGTTVATKGNVIDITTSNVSGKNAFNSFDKFKLTPNNIANMYFGSKESNKAENLFNFVKDKVDIEGTVNAIKDNKIGGNLYFLSTDGAVIGASGVVNTGALYIVAPTQEVFKKALNSAKKGSVYVGIVPNTNGKVNIPLNPSGTITVRGKINAVDEIGMYAANITIENEKETRAAPTGNTAVIQTGVLDFGSLVNIKGVEGVDSGLGPALTATQTTDKGDIILMASATEVSSGGTTTSAENDFGNVAEINKGKIYAGVTSDGEIKASGNVKISATASNDEYVTGKESSRSSSSIADVKAEVNITGGKIEGKDVNIEALAQNFYDTPISITAGKFAVSVLGAMSPINMAGGLALLSSESDIKIGKDAEIAAEENLKLNSLSEVRAIVGASTAAIKLRPSGGGKVPSIATAYVETGSNANITVDGKLSSKETDIGAKSTNKIEAAVDSGTQIDNSKVGLAVLVTDGKNKSSVEIGKDAEIISQGEMSITSKAENSLYREAVNNLGNSGRATLTANIGMYESSSNIDIAGTVQTDGDLTIDSSNTTKENTLITKSQNGKSSFQNNVFWDSDQTQQLMKNIQGAFGAKTNFQTKDSTEDLFKVGAVAAVAIQDNNANINIKNTANISSEGDINLKALNTVEDTHMITGSKVYSTSKGQTSSSDILISAGVLYADIKNNSGITLEDESGANATSIAAGKNLNINSAVNMEYNRPEKLVEEFLENITALKELFSNAPSSLTNDLASDDGTEELSPLTDGDIEEVESLYTQFKNVLDGNPDLLLNGNEIEINESNGKTKTGSALEIAEYIAGRTEEFSKKVDKKSEEILNSTKPAAQNGDPSTDWIYDTKYLLEGIGGIIKDAAEFASVGNYANFYTYSSGEGSKEGQTVTAGSASWVDLNNNSKISIGRGAVLTAGEELTVDSKNVTEAVGIAGKLVPSLSAKSTSVGGTMNVQKFNTSSIIEAAEKAKLTGGDGIAINSESDIFHVGTTINSGTGTNALIGLVSYSGGDSDNQVSIDDETLLESEKGIEITANNDTSVTNIAGGLTYGNRAASVGLAVAINDYNVTNRAAIEDNDISRFEKSKYEKNNEVTVKASSLDVTANTTGTINSVSVAGAISKSGDDGKQGIFKKLNEKYTGLQSKINSGLEKVTGKLNSWVGSDKQKGLSSIVGVGQGGGTGGSEEQAPSLSLGAAGSSSANLLKNETTALVDGANIQLKEESTGINTEKAGEINVEAKDSAFQGAWSGAAALQWNHSGSDSSSNKSVGVEAAVALNKINNDTNASIKNSAIENAESISVNSLSGGTQVAAGLGLDASKDSGSGGKNYQGGASASINLIDHKVTAEMVDNTVAGNKTSLDVTAYESDIQVTGGVNIQTGKSSGAVGAAATVADINNTVTARIKDGTYKDVEDISVKGLLATTQVTAAAAMGITKSDSEASNMLLEGAVAVDLLNNTINSTIDGAEITESKNVVVLAQDTKPNLGYQAKLDGDYKEYLEEREIDYTGKGYYEGISLKEYDSEEPETIKDTDGALIVSAAASIAGTDGVSLGAGVAVNEIANKFNAEIKNSNISAENVAADAQSATSIIGVAGGAAVSTKKFAGMGSVSWQELNNETTSKIENSKITASNVNAKAANSDYGLNIGGQISVGKSAAMGAVLANSYLNNKASAYILGTSISSPNNSGVNVNAAADNNAHIITIGAGVSASKKAAINGTVAINRGGNKTEAKIDESDTKKDSKINNASSIDVTAQDNTKLKAIAGSVKAGKVAVGGDVAYSDIGGSSTESAKSSQEVLAKLNNTNITTITTYMPSSSAEINVSAIDKSNLLTIAVGVGGGENVAVEGAAATALVNKNLEASMTGANINKENENNENADVKITAENESILMTSADVAAVGEKAGIGAGVGVNRIIQNISAILSGGTQNVKNALVKSKAKSEITTIGVGGGVAGKAGIAGSIAVNMITNNNTASVKDGAKLTAKGNAGVIAQSDEIISNYAGTLAVGANVGLGVSTSINEISGRTLSSIEGTGTAVIAKGETKDTITTKSNIKDGSIFDECIPEDSVLMGENLSNNRVEEEKQGIVVDSSAAHTLKSLLVTAGGAVEGAGIAGTVNVNTISGDTTAKIDKAALSGGDVSITAKDYINSGGIVGSIAIAGEGVGIGASSDTNILDRTTKTSVENSNITGNNIKIGADSKQGISSFGAAAGIAAIGGGAAGTVSVSELSGTTITDIENSDITAEENLNIDSTHTEIVSIGNAAAGVGAVGVGIGAGVGVTKDETTTKTLINGSSLSSQNEMGINTENKTKLNTAIVAAGAGGAAVSGSVSVNNIKSIVETDIIGRSLTSEKNNISIKSNNNIDTSLTSVGAAVGAVGVSGVVSVNTIDSSVLTNIAAVDITAANGKIDISSEETRDIDQTAVSAVIGQAAVGVNVMTNNFGTAVSDKADVKNKIAAANQLQNEKIDETTQGILAGKGVEKKSYTVEAENGGTPTQTGIKVEIENSRLTAKNIGIAAKETDNIKMTGGGASGGLVSASGAVALVDIARSNGVNISNSTIAAAEKLDISNEVTGKAELDVYQGNVGAIALNTAYAEINAKGDSSIKIAGSILSGKNIAANSEDNSALKVNANGLTIGGIALGAIIADAENNASSKITILNSDIKSEENLEIKSKKENTVEAVAKSGTAGLASGAGSSAKAVDSGASSVAITESGSTIKGNNSINISADNNPNVSAKAGTLAAGIVTGIGGALSKAEINSTASLTIDSGNTFTGNTINLGANIIGKGKADTTGSGGGIVGINYNEAAAVNKGEVKVNIEDETYTGVKTSKADININGKNSVTLNAETTGKLGGIFASGNNKAKTTSKGTTAVTVGNGTGKDVIVKGETITTNTAKADGSGGGIISVDGMAAQAENNVENTTTTKIEGNWNIGSSLSVNALESNTATLSVDSSKGSVVGYSGTKAINNIASKGTIVNLSGNITGDGTVSALAKNTTKVDMKALGSGYGGIVVSGAQAKNTISGIANVNISGIIDTGNKQKFEALSDGNVDIYSFVEAGGLGAATTAGTSNDMTSNNTVTLTGSLKTEKEDQDITLASSDTVKASVKAEANTQGGAAGGATAETVNEITRTNKVDVSGNIRSMDDVNLYAGKDGSGKKGRIEQEVAAEAYNSAFIPVAAPTLKNEVEQNNNINVASDKKVESVRDINLFANEGEVRMSESNIKYTWATGTDETGSYVTSSQGDTESKGFVKKNSVDIAGDLTAGIQNKQEITISGTVDFDKKSENELGTIKGADNEPTIVASEEVDKTKIKYGIIENYGEELKEQYDYLTERINEYSKLGDTKTVASLESERIRIKDQIESLGLGFVSPKTGDFVMTGSLELPYIEIPDIIASGGNIVVDTDNMKGSGKLAAQGAPQITVTNNTNLYLKVNDLIIGDLGGEIKYNGTPIGVSEDSGKLNAIINNLNKDGEGASYSGIKTFDPGKAEITVENTWGNKKVNVITEIENGEIKTSSMNVLSNIEIGGTVRNLLGIVNVINAGGDILIQGDLGSGKSGGSINAEEINLSAPKGSVSQGFTDGIVNIGSSPDAPGNWGDVSDKIIRDYITDKLDKDKPNHNVFSDNTDKSQTSGGIVAGGNIYINASDINVNGLIQSGFSEYSLELTDEDMKQINAIEENWIAAGRPEITDDLLYSYKINADGGKYNGAKYIVQAYYNPQSGEVVVEDIDPKGGQIYLTGRITSTGNGSIKALDGGANIDIINNTSKNLQVNNISNGNAQGLISITDTREDKDTEGKTVYRTITTEYRKDSTKAFEYKTNQNGEVVREEIENGLFKDSYNPDAGLRYNWLEGSKKEDGTKYEWSKKFTFWGLIHYSEKNIMDKIKDATSTKIEANTSKAPDGIYIGKVDEIRNDQQFGLVFTNGVTDNRTVIDKDETKYNNWTHFSGTQYYEWTHSYASGQTYLSSVKADKPISIDFMGNEDGEINIKSNKDVSIFGNLKNNTAEAKTTINSEGKIDQISGTDIYSNNISLTAKNGIEGIGVVSIGIKDSHDTVNLNVVTDKGNIGIDVSAGFLDGNRIEGNVNVNEISTGSGQVSLSAKGDIKQKNSGSIAIAGNRINLVSGGDIDLIVQGGTGVLSAADSMNNSINAQASKDINLTQASGDFRIGTVASEKGDVTLTVKNGNLVDALPTGEIVSNEGTDEKIQKWKDMGLLDNKSAEEIKADYEAGVKKAFEDYANLKTQKDEFLENLEKQDISSDAKAKAEDDYMNQYNGAKKNFEEKYGKSNTADEYLATNKDKDIEKIKGAQWTEDNLLYAIKESMANQTGGSTQKEVKNPNIIGHNITLNVEQGGVGVDKASETVDLMGLNKNIDALKKLASSEVADVEWKDGASTAIISHKNPIGIQMKNSESGNGKLDVTAGGNVYLAARTEGDTETNNNTIYIDKIKTNEGNIRVLGTGGIYNVTETKDNINFTGKDLIIEGGKENLGTSDKNLTTALKGTLTARADGNIYMNQVENGDMQVASIYSGKDIVLNSTAGIVSVPNELGYIRTDNGNITLTAGGSIGDSNGGQLRIKNTSSDKKEITATAKGDICILGKADTSDGGSTEEFKLTLGDIEAGGNVDISGEAGLEVKKNITSGTGKNINLKAEKDIKIAGEDITGQNINLTAENNISLESGKLEGTNTVNLNANTGKIEQTGNNIIADSVTATAVEGINLSNAGNKFNSITASNTQNDILIKNSGDKGLNVTVEEENKGNIVVDNITGALAVLENIIASGEGSSISLTNKNGNITTSNNLTTGKDILISTETGDIISGGTITSGGMTTVKTDSQEPEKGTIKLSTVNSDGDLLVTTQNGAITGETLTSKGKADIQTGTGTIDLTKVDSTGKINIITAVGNITGNTIESKAGDIDIESTEKGNIELSNVNSAGNLLVITKDGNIKSDKANAVLKSGGTADIQTGTGNIKLNEIASAKDMTVKSTETGTIDLTAVNSTGNLLVSSKNGMITGGTLTSDGTTTVKTASQEPEEGTINLSTANSAGDLLVSTQNGNIMGNTIESKAGNIDIESTEKGNIELSNVNSAGNLLVTTKDGNIKSDKANAVLKSGGKADIQTGTGNISLNKITSSGDMNISTQTGTITGETLTSDGTTTVETKEEGAIDLTAINSTGNLLVSSKNGMITGETLTSKGKADIQTGTGNISLNKITSSGDMNISTQTGTITGGTLTSDGITTVKTASQKVEDGTIGLTNVNSVGDLLVSTQTGAITGETLTSKGKADIQTGTGNISLNKITSSGDMNISTQTGTIAGETLTSDGTTTVKTASQKVEDGTIDLTTVNSAGNLLVSTQNGNITGNTIKSTAGDASVESTEKGDISINEELFAGNQATVRTKSGKIFIKNLTANDRISVETLKDGEIASTGLIKSVNDSLRIYSAKGDVNLNDVYANKVAMVGATDGDVIIGEINGETIILTLENSNKKLLTEKMIVGKNILTTSSQIGIDDLTQRKGYDNTIVFSPRNPDPTKPMKELKMESIKLENGFLVDELWAEYAKMNLIGMKLELPKLRIVDKGYFNNSTISTTVFGADSPFDDSNVNIWNDASDNSSWIQLLFLTTGQTIYTNGVLLKGQDYYYTYDQRASGVDIMVKKLEAPIKSKEKEDSFISSSADLYKPYWNTGLVNNDTWSNEGELKVKVGTGTEEMQLNKPKLYLSPIDNNITINEDEDDIIAKADTEKTK